MPTKIEAALTHEQFQEFCQKLLKLPGKARTLGGVQALAAEYGITVSQMGAKAFKDGPFARHLEKLHRGREVREALCSAAGAGVHPLDALEEAAVMELQDHFTEAEGGKVDVAFVTKQLLALRTSISMRGDAKRKDADLERKQRETEAKLALAEQQRTRLQEQNAKLIAEREAREAALQAKASAAGAAINKPKATADEIRAQTVALIDEIMGIKTKKA